jgi:hypothetical protein
MGGLTKIHLKDPSKENIKFVNDILTGMKLAKSFRFYSEADVELEYKCFVDGEGTFPDDQFPKNQIKSYDDFKNYWSTEALGEVFVPKFGCLSFDCYFGRTSQTAMNLIANFLYSYRYLIGEVSGSYLTFVNDKISISQKKRVELIKLDTTEEPVMLPKEERTDDSIQSGQWLCKSWGNEPFWVVYGNVDSPTFMKKKIYVDDLYNNLYKTKNGLAVLLMPLMPLGSPDTWFIDHIDKAMNMGLREHPNVLLSVVYGVCAVDYKSIVAELDQWYTQKEIVSRFNLMYNEIKSTYNRPMGFVYRESEDEFIPLSNLAKIKAQCQVLNIMYKASDVESWKELLKI